MALKYLDGFEQYTAASNIVTNLVQKSISNNYYSWSNWGGSFSTQYQVVTTQYRTAQANASALVMGNNGTSFYMPFPQNQEIIVGFGFLSSVNRTNPQRFLNFHNVCTDNNSAKGVYVQLRPDGSIQVVNEALAAGSDVLGASAPGAMIAHTWQYFEIKISFGASANFEIRVNNQTVLSASGVNTLGGNTSVNGLNLTNPAVWDYHYFDDFYICDTTGTTNNDFLGPLSVYTLFPNANGSINEFTASSGINYQAVNTREGTTSSYVFSSTAGHKEFYTVDDLLVSTGNVHGVMARSYGSIIDAGARKIQVGIKSGASESYSSNLTQSLGSWISSFAVFEKQADGVTDWDIAAVNATEVGFKNT